MEENFPQEIEHKGNTYFLEVKYLNKYDPIITYREPVIVIYYAKDNKVLKINDVLLSQAGDLTYCINRFANKLKSAGILES